MRVVLFGPPGSGKGTQADFIEKKYGFPKISTGDLLRRAVEEGTPLGKKAESEMSRGELVSDDVVEELVTERISSADCRMGYVLDGFPRNITQAQALEKMDGGRPEIVIEIQMSANNLISRLASRRVCSQCGAIYNLNTSKPKKEGICDVCGAVLVQREDDRIEVIRERLRIYQEQTQALRDYYQGKNVYRRLDGSQRADSLSRKISSVLDVELAKFREKEATK